MAPTQKKVVDDAPKEDQLAEIRGITMAHILCRNTGLTTVSKNAFVIGSFKVECDTKKDINFCKWMQTHGLWSEWRPFSSCIFGYKFRIRSCITSDCPCQGSPFDQQPCTIAHLTLEDTSSDNILESVIAKLKAAIDGQDDNVTKEELDRFLRKSVDEAKRESSTSRP